MMAAARQERQLAMKQGLQAMDLECEAADAAACLSSRQSGKGAAQPDETPVDVRSMSRGVDDFFFNTSLLLLFYSP